MEKFGWEYIKSLQPEDTYLPECWSVARIHGIGFHKLASLHKWKRPTDERALKLMTRAAKSVMLDLKDITMAYGHNDEYSFVFKRETQIFERRAVKIVAAIVSQFSAAFAVFWNEFFPDTELQFPPSFDCCIWALQTHQNVRDYFSWRQAECHFENLYNTAYSNLLQDGVSKTDVEKELSGASVRVLNEILLSRFNMEYKNKPELYKQGTVIILPATTNGFLSPKEKIPRRDSLLDKFIELNCCVEDDTFWGNYPHVLNSKALKMLADLDKEKKRMDVADLGPFQGKIPQRSRSNSVNLPVKFSYDDARNVGLQLGKIADDYKQTTSPERRTSLQSNGLF
ncbi:unnamed protein product [Allacma fusca]|uniref:Probable tRNA(His) guanylyltransferase n=1 Tax=Allacma fusca TaxID=39272 RepID=A0A8J2JMU1_9HEXA|nr:unnamed protein product [Allacma fusca]